MPIIYDLRHTSTYRYAAPVNFGPHRIMFRPRASHDLRVLASDLDVSPESEIRLIQDVHSNSIAIVQPRQAADTLRIDCSFTIEHAGTLNLELPIDDRAVRYPFCYSADDWVDLEAYVRPGSDDPEGKVESFARQFVTPGKFTKDLLVDMTRHLRDRLVYQARISEGTQHPADTLSWGTGTCRDFAWLMIESVRRLGFAARFVSGYLYDPLLDGLTDGGMTGSGATHAWLQVYLPGAGWVPFDPTNTLFGGTQLIRVAVAREPRQAIPILGTWNGYGNRYLGLEAHIVVRRRAN